MQESRIRKWLPLVGAVLIYLAICWALAVGTAGPEADEVLSYDGAARLALGQANLPCRSGISFRFLHRCWPLTVTPYIGAPKDYFLLPAFLVFGAHAGVARMGAAVLAAIGIAGVFLFLSEARDRTTAIIAAYLLAIHPSYIDLSTFDRGVVAFEFGVLGASLIVLSMVAKKVSWVRFLALGFLVGFGVWARLNYSWLVVSAFAGALIAYRRELFRLRRYAPVFLLGAIVGVWPVVAYLRKHLHDLLAYMNVAPPRVGFGLHLADTFTRLRDVLFADMQHRIIWGGDMVPSWQSWLAVTIATLALLWCFIGVRTRIAVALTVTTACLAVFYLTTRLRVAEHHLVIFVPLVAMVVGVVVSDLLRRGPAARGLAALVLSLFAFGALRCDLQAAEGLHRTRGRGEWSARVYDLARQIEQLGPHPLYELDWGLQEPLFLASGGKLYGTGLYFDGSGTQADDGRSWADVVAHGGVFVTYGNRYLHFPLATVSFRRMLACEHANYREIPVRADDGTDYALLYVVSPKPAADEKTREACLTSPAEEFYASPNPVTVAKAGDLGETTLFFTTTKSSAVQIRVGAPDGTLLSVYFSMTGVTSGIATTGKWVSNGTAFYLQDIANGKKLDAANTLATVRVAVAPAH